MAWNPVIVGGLGPLIAAAAARTRHLGIAKFEMEVTIGISEVLEPVQGGEQVSFRIVGVLVHGVVCVRKQASCCVVTEDLLEGLLCSRRGSMCGSSGRSNCCGCI